MLFKSIRHWSRISSIPIIPTCRAIVWPSCLCSAIIRTRLPKFIKRSSSTMAAVSNVESQLLITVHENAFKNLFDFWMRERNRHHAICVTSGVCFRSGIRDLRVLRREPNGWRTSTLQSFTSSILFLSSRGAPKARGKIFFSLNLKRSEFNLLFETCSLSFTRTQDHLPLNRINL